MIRYFGVAVGAWFICVALTVHADELTFGSKSARDVFKDQRVFQLLLAATHGDEQEANRLVNSGVDVNAIGEDNVTPLLWVLAKHDLNAAKILLEAGADPNKFAPSEIGESSLGYPPIWAAAGGGQKDMLQAMLDRGGNPNQVFGNESVLMTAIANSHLDCAELLLQHGADINFFKGPMSAFSEAMGNLQYDNVLWVLKHGYTHDLPMAKRMLAMEKRKTRPGQEEMKAEALEIVAHSLAARQQ